MVVRGALAGGAVGATVVASGVRLAQELGWTRMDIPFLLGTIEAVRRELADGPYVRRFVRDDGGEGAFLACSFWLVSALAANGRVERARALFERLLGLSNDLGLLAEEYDVAHRRQVGNFPQAFSHLTLILAARAITAAEAGAEAAGTAGTRAAA